MIEISFGKLVVLALIALIVLGPEKLPGAARTVGALVRRVRGGWDNVRAEVERELELEQIKRAARDAAAQAEALQNQLKDGVRQVQEPLAQAVDGVTDVARSAAAPLPSVPVQAAEPPSSPAPVDQPQGELPLSGSAQASAPKDHEKSTA